MAVARVMAGIVLVQDVGAPSPERAVGASERWSVRKVSEYFILLLSRTQWGSVTREVA